MLIIGLFLSLPYTRKQPIRNYTTIYRRHQSAIDPLSGLIADGFASRTSPTKAWQRQFLPSSLTAEKRMESKVKKLMIWTVSFKSGDLYNLHSDDFYYG